MFVATSSRLFRFSHHTQTHTENTFCLGKVVFITNFRAHCVCFTRTHHSCPATPTHPRNTLPGKGAKRAQHADYHRLRFTRRATGTGHIVFHFAVSQAFLLFLILLVVSINKIKRLSGECVCVVVCV